MSTPQPITLTLDRRLIEHPRAYHVRRMRQGLWLYLAILARLPAGARVLELEPQAVGAAMGLPEGTIRSWLGHLAKAGYVRVERLGGTIRISVRDVHTPTADVQLRTSQPTRFFTVARLEEALGEQGQRAGLEAALNLHSDGSVRRALAGALAVPGPQIRRSRTALFLYLLKRYPHASTN